MPLVLSPTLPLHHFESTCHVPRSQLHPRLAEWPWTLAKGWRGCSVERGTSTAATPARCCPSGGAISKRIDNTRPLASCPPRCQASLSTCLCVPSRGNTNILESVTPDLRAKHRRTMPDLGTRRGLFKSPRDTSGPQDPKDPAGLFRIRVTPGPTPRPLANLIHSQ